MIVFSSLDRDSSVSMRDQLREKLSRRIFQGVLAPGTRLPSCRALAKQLRISRNTVLNAYEMMKEDQLIESHERSGYFVRRDLRSLNFDYIGHDGKSEEKLWDIGGKVNFPVLPLGPWDYLATEKLVRLRLSLCVQSD